MSPQTDFQQYQAQEAKRELKANILQQDGKNRSDPNIQNLQQDYNQKFQQLESARQSTLTNQNLEAHPQFPNQNWLFSVPPKPEEHKASELSQLR